MRTFQGHNPETRRVQSCKSQSPKKKFHKLSDAVEVQIIDDDDDDDSGKDYSMEDTSKQLVLYNPDITHDKQSAAIVTKPIAHYSSPHQRFMNTRYRHGTVLPSIGAYTVQCAQCFKWRVVPTKEKYEELRENICQELFVCVRANEWNRVLSCDDPEDVSQDGSRLWAIDKPNIAQPRPGWDREVRIRGEGCSKFADVYYTSPSGRKLRSMVEIGRYLAENPHYIQQGVNLSHFSFATPKPLQEDYVRKRTYAEGHELPEIPEPAEVDPLCWAAPPTRRELLGELGTSTSNPVDLDPLEVVEAPALRTKKRKKRTLKQRSPRKRQIAPPSCSFKEQPRRCPNDIEHVLL